MPLVCMVVLYAVPSRIHIAQDYSTSGAIPSPRAALRLFDSSADESVNGVRIGLCLGRIRRQAFLKSWNEMVSPWFATTKSES
jgi:hypothetical protein